MSATADSTLLDTLTPVQVEVLEALVEGASITAAAQKGGVHRSTVHLWTRNHPAFARTLLAARQDRADRLLDELSDLGQLACDTFRHLLNDPNTPAATRLKAAMEIVKLVQNQRPTELAQLKAESPSYRLHLAKIADATPLPPPPSTEPAPGPATATKQPVRNAPCPCGSRLKYKRCCGNLATRTLAA
jgi:transposase-like protein